MQFRSNFKCFQAIVRHGHKVYHPVTGTELRDKEVKALIAEFGIHGGEYTVIDPDTGLTNTFADIRGYFFDSDEAAAREKWTEEEKEAVEARLLELSERWPEAVQVHAGTKYPIPFPTYMDVDDDAIAKLCIDLGLAEQALAYEQQNDQRPAVVKELQEFLASKPVESEPEELTAA